MSRDIRFGFIGFGRMGGALAAGAIHAGVVGRRQVVGIDHTPSKLSKAGFRSLDSVKEVVEGNDIVFLAVKPQGMMEPLEKKSILHI